MESAVQNVRKSHKLLMTTTLSQHTASGMFRSSYFPQNDGPAARDTSSTSCERKRFKTIQKNGCVRFVQQKQMAAVKPAPDRSETDSNSQHPLRHKRSSTSIQFKSDAVTETMKVRLEGKIQEARNKLEAMKTGFQRCLQKKQEIVNNVKNAKIVTRRFSLAT